MSNIAPADRVQRSYVDWTGQHRECAPEGVAAVLDILGDDPDPVESVVVAWDGVLPLVDTSLTVLDGAGTALTGTLPLGYHVLARNGQPVGTVVSAPRQAPASSLGRWGVMLPLYALRTSRTDGIASYGELGPLFEWLRAHGGDVLLTLPLLPLYLDDPADWSPYSPVTRRLWSELYIDLDAAGAPPVDPAPSPEGRLLDYPALHRHRTPRLDAVAERRVDDPGLQSWLRDNPVALRHARFRGAQARHGRNFRAWRVSREQALTDADPVVVRRHLVGAWLAEQQLAAVARAAQGADQVLGLDVALGVHADGFDVWDEGDLFVNGSAVGAPPDEIFRGGQDWGFPPVHPARSRRTGHRYFRDTLRHHLRHSRLLRLDHVMGLARQWWVPAGLAASAGCYVRYPLEELFAVACLEAHLAGAVIVGENLGVVPPEIYSGLAEHRLLGISLTLGDLASYGTDGMRRAAQGNLAMSSTHDSVPFASYWHGGDIDLAHRLQLLDDHQRDLEHGWRAGMRERTTGYLYAHGLLHGEPTPMGIIAGVAQEMASQPAAITVFNLEDLWCEQLPQNVPGTFQEEPNWRRVAAHTIDELADDADLARLADEVSAHRRDSAAHAFR